MATGSSGVKLKSRSFKKDDKKNKNIFQPIPTTINNNTKQKNIIKNTNNNNTTSSNNNTKPTYNIKPKHNKKPITSPPSSTTTTNNLNNHNDNNKNKKNNNVKPMMLAQMDPTATAKRSSSKLFIPLSVPFTQFSQFINEIQLISSQTDALDVAYIVIRETSKSLQCDRSSFFFVDGDFLDLVIAKGVDSIRMPKTAGFAGACATTGKMVNIPDAYLDKRFNKKWDKINKYRTKQILCAAIVDDIENEVIGVLQCINKNDDNPFDAIDESLISCLSNQIAVSMRYAIQMEEAKQAQSQKNALISYIKNMNANTNVPSLLFTLNKAAQELLEADRCTFYTIDHNQKSLHIINADSSIDIKLSLSQGIAGSVATSGKKINIPNCYNDKRFDQSFDKQSGYKTISMLVMPVFKDVKSQRNKEKPIAVVQLINKNKGEDVFTLEDEELLGVLIRFIGPLIKDSKLFQKKVKKKEAVLKHIIDRQPSTTFELDKLNGVIEEEDDDVDWKDNLK